MDLVEHGLYIIKDEYFIRFPYARWNWNKDENRPCYYAVKDKTGIFWMIPMTSQVVGMKERIKKAEEKHGTGNCLFYHIGIVAGKECGFKIGNMFPVTEKYVLRQYEFFKKPYVIQTESLNKALRSKAMKYLSMVRAGKASSDCDMISIMHMLLSD